MGDCLSVCAKTFLARLDLPCHSQESWLSADSLVLISLRIQNDFSIEKDVRLVEALMLTVLSVTSVHLSCSSVFTRRKLYYDKGTVSLNGATASCMNAV